MATRQLVNPQTLNNMTHLPAFRQLALLVGLAASIAVGVYVVLWSQDPSQRLLYGGLSEKDVSQVVEALQSNGIPFKLDPRSGGISVPDKDLYQARLKLAEQGLPKGGSRGFEMLEKDSSFGTSQFMETARYHHAMEGELGRSIMSMRSVKAARVHIAIPRQSAFVRNRQRPTASVLVELYGGRDLDAGQVAAIAHLVSSSIPQMSTDDVTVVDQNGRLLTQQQGNSDVAMSTAQLNYVRSLEQSYMKRIENLLAPVVGPGGVRAQVSAEVDFTMTEQTEERFTPDPGKVRSEQIVEENIGGDAGAAAAVGIPGAVSNEPGNQTTATAGATATPAPGANASATQADKSRQSSGSRRSTRNYELDKTISHVKTAPGRILKISIAVVVDNKKVVDANGDTVRQPRTEEELKRFTALVREAVGFKAERGDSVQVINTSFVQAPEIELIPEPPLWQRPMVLDIGKQALAGMVILFIIFGVLRPVLRGLATRPAPPPSAPYYGAAVGALPPGAGNPGNLPALVDGQASPGTQGGAGYENAGSMDAAKGMIQQDARRAAQVVKSWVANDA